MTSKLLPHTVLTLFLSLPSVAAEKFVQKVAPFVDVRGTQSDQRAELGISLEFSKFRLRPTLAVDRPNDASAATLSTEAFAFGASVDALARFGTGVSNINAGSHLAFGLTLGWTGRDFKYGPSPATQEHAFRNNWSGAITFWWFKAIQTSISESSQQDETNDAGTSLTVSTVDHRAFIIHPQIRIEYRREFKSGDDKYLVQAPDTAGNTYADKVVVDAPSAIPKFAIRLAVPIAPPSFGRFALGPAFKLNSSGRPAGFAPFASATRLVLELWGYFFAFDAESEKDLAVRVGVSPFVDFRIVGTDKRDSVVAGIAFELRTGTTRLEY